MATLVRRIIRMVRSPQARKALAQAQKAARSEQGRKIVAKAQAVARDPKSRSRLAAYARRISRR